VETIRRRTKTKCKIEAKTRIFQIAFPHREVIVNVAIMGGKITRGVESGGTSLRFDTPTLLKQKRNKESVVEGSQGLVNFVCWLLPKDIDQTRVPAELHKKSRHGWETQNFCPCRSWTVVAASNQRG